MALELTKELSSGVEGEYWKIEAIEMNPYKTTVRLALYKDAAARAAEKAPLQYSVHEFYGADNPCSVVALESESAYVLCYDKLKELDEFDGALDV